MNTESSQKNDNEEISNNENENNDTIRSTPPKKIKRGFHNIPIPIILDNTYTPYFEEDSDYNIIRVLIRTIIEYFMHHGEIFIHGTISLASVKGVSKMMVLAGQHYVVALKFLNRILDLSDHNIYIELYDFEVEEDAEKMYETITSHRMRKAEFFNGDLEPFMFPMFDAYFTKKYGKYCKTSENPRGICINIEQMLKRMRGLNFLSRACITPSNSEEWLKMFDDYNDFLSKQSDDKLIEWGHSKSLIDLARESGFYFGLYRSYEWLERIVDRQLEIEWDDQDNRTNELMVKECSDHLDPELKSLLWTNKAGKDTKKWKCVCCKEDVKKSDFECGFIRPIRSGGTIVLENLDITCKSCYYGAGTMGIYIYRILYKEKENKVEKEEKPKKEKKEKNEKNEKK